jgi:EAL domain-containing protein (putative c-di-GMP-specific phosphodiesterase class I)
LIDMRCDKAQGYHLSHPIGGAAMSPFLHAH